MSAPKREYSRLYHDLVDDEEFRNVYPDDGVFGLWARLLIDADKAWPTSASLPLGVNKGRLEKLVVAGLVIVTGARYRIRGMDKERGSRSDHGKRGADGRWHGPEQSPSDAGGDDDGMLVHPSGNASASGEHPSGNARGMPSKDEQSRAKQRRAEQEQSARASIEGDTIHDVVHRLTAVYLAPSSKNGGRLDRWVEKLGRERVERELRETADDLGGLPETNQLLNSTEDRLFPTIAAPSPKEQRVEFEADQNRKATERAIEATERRRRELENPTKRDYGLSPTMQALEAKGRP